MQPIVIAVVSLIVRSIKSATLILKISGIKKLKSVMFIPKRMTPDMNERLNISFSSRQLLIHVMAQAMTKLLNMHHHRVVSGYSSKEE